MRHPASSWEVEGTSRNGKPAPVWKVFFYVTGEWTCNCPAWCKNFPRVDCKHILKVKLDMATKILGERTEEVVNKSVGNRPKRRIR